MDYYAYWGLNGPPFTLTPDPSKLYMSRRHTECLLRLKYAVTTNKGGALLVSQNAGDGKTSVLKKLVEELEAEYPEQYRVAFVSHPTLTPRQMIQEIARQTGCEIRRRDKMRTLNEFQEYLLELGRRGKRALVIVDEGQMLVRRPDVLDELRTLLNFCVGDRFLLSFILSGQRPLERAIRSMPEFWQRLPVRFFLGNLDAVETRRMLEHRLALAGKEEGRVIFTLGAFSRIFEFSGGCPRIACSIADLAIVVGQARRVREIDVPEIEEAAADMERPGSSSSFHYYHAMKKGRAGGGTAQRPRRVRKCPVCLKEVAMTATVCGHCGFDPRAKKRLKEILERIRRLRPGAGGADVEPELILQLPRKRFPLRAPASVEVRSARLGRRRYKSGLVITTDAVEFEGALLPAIGADDIRAVRASKGDKPRLLLATHSGVTYEVNIRRADKNTSELLSLASEMFELKIKTRPKPAPKGSPS